MARAIERIGLPVMVKGACYKAHRAYTTQEAAGYYASIVAKWGYPIIIQQVVTGEEMNVTGVGDGEGGTLGLVGIKKIMVTSLGKIWTGVTVKNERMLSAAGSFVQRYRWKGPFELECIIDKDNLHLIEINPRFPAWCYFATGVGINLPSLMLRKAFGMEMPAPVEYEAGKLYIRYTYEVISEMKPFKEMMTKGEWQS